MTDKIIIGLDISKKVFQVHGINKQGKPIIKKRLYRDQVLSFTSKLSKSVIAMESCGGSHYWGRKFKEQGHGVRLISPQFVKPYVKGNKNDENDSEAISEAASRASMRFVPVKTIEQQDIQSIHRLRSRIIGQRTQIVNQTRGLLLEYGIAISKGITKFRKKLPEIITTMDNGLTEYARSFFNDLYEELCWLDKRIKEYDKKIKEIFATNEACQRIGAINGVGVIAATAIIAAISDAKEFKNGRNFAAWLGLVPKQFSSGGKDRLLGISKRGDSYLRTILIHGARSVLMNCKNQKDKIGIWLSEIKERAGFNKACVALANKNARIIWALLANKTEYKRA